jgi:succinyl-CoA synthetase alpha subunit
MSILIDESTEVIIQGITGREARLRAHQMKEYGTKLVAGVTPGRGGEDVEGVPVFDTIAEAKRHFPGIAATSIFVPASTVKEAGFEAIDAGLRVVILHPERVPQQDMLEIIQYNRDNGASIVVGPNSLGVISPGKALMGMIGGRADTAREFFKAGAAGVISRSGGNTTTLSYYLTKAGVGQTTSISMGGDACVGSTYVDYMKLFEQDPDTKLVAIFGEIGTSAEEDLADFIRSGGFTKPVIAYISGTYARAEMRFGHAGAIISGGRGTTEAKREALRSAGVIVLEHFGDAGLKAREALGRRRPSRTVLTVRGR